MATKTAAKPQFESRKHLLQSVIPNMAGQQSQNQAKSESEPDIQNAQKFVSVTNKNWELNKLSNKFQIKFKQLQSK